MECERNEDGDLITKLNNKYHSFDDKPAIISTNGDQYWYKEGKLHRDRHFPGREDDLPARIYVDGGQYWYKEGKLHRDGDLPAIIRSSGAQWWYKEGRCHRDGDLPAIIYYGKYEWWVNDKLIKRCDHYNPRVKSARNI